MKKIFYLFFAVALLACGKEETAVVAPSSVSGVQVEPRVGGALLKWTLPADSNFLYLEVRYKKNDQVITTNVSKYTDTVLVEGLLNKLDYVFEIQPFNGNEESVVAGELLTSNAVKPIRRPIEITYFPDQLTKIEGITADMLDAFTQESSEGPKENLIDGDKNTYWHSAWSANTAPLPHWIQVNFEEPVSMGAIKYFFRQSGDKGGRPSQFALDTSEDGVTWARQWTSKPDLSVEPMSDEKSLAFDKNFSSKHFRIVILANPGNTSFTHLGDISFYTMKEELTDMEKLAEENY